MQFLSHGQYSPTRPSYAAGIRGKNSCLLGLQVKLYFGGERFKCIECSQYEGRLTNQIICLSSLGEVGFMEMVLA
jgi:hypothetical protein